MAIEIPIHRIKNYLSPVQFGLLHDLVDTTDSHERDWLISGVPGEPIPVSSEEEIFEIIDFPYKKPEERNV